MKFITNLIIKKASQNNFENPQINYTGLDGNMSMGITPNKTPHAWQRATDEIRQQKHLGMGDNFDLGDFVKAHIPNVPGVNHELNITNHNRQRDSNYAASALDFDYRANHPTSPKELFSYQGRYRRGFHDDGPEMFIEGMYNNSRFTEDEKNSFAPQVISQLIPYGMQKGVQKIRTNATSYPHEDPRRSMNGGNTWAKLGFQYDPDSPNANAETLTNLNRHIENLRHTNPELPDIGEYPYLPDSLHALRYPGQLRNVLTDLGYGKHAGPLANATLNQSSYPAMLSLNKEDPGFQRTMQYINMMNSRSKKLRGATASQASEHIHKGHLREVFPWMTEEEELQMLLLEDALWETHKEKDLAD